MSTPEPPAPSVAVSVTVTGRVYVPPLPGVVGLNAAVVVGAASSAAASTSTLTVLESVPPSPYVTVSLAV